jgi:uncharacterized membrane protein
MAPLLPVTTVGVALVGGAFFAFSAFVMQGLDRASGREATIAMQGINETAVTSVFMLAFIGTTLLCLALAVWGALHLGDVRGKLVLAGSAVYVVGVFLVTVAGNVPLNDKLAKAKPGAAAWHDFYGSWMALNHTRTIASAVALVLLLLALERGE